MTKAAVHQRHIAVIGGGWAGSAAAVTLARQGCQVSLFESARVLGGRARRVSFRPVTTPDSGMTADITVDNGQHILLGAYTSTLALLKTIGIDSRDALLRLPLQMCYPPGTGGMHFVAPRLPAPWHITMALLRATGLSRDDKLSLARFSTSAKWMKWTLYDDCSVAELLDRFDQTDHLIRLLWEPLCIAALNTPIRQASARLFLHVLRDSLGARRAASDMLVPRVNLSSLLPDAAARYIVAHGGAVHTGTAVHTITAANDDASCWQVADKEGAVLAQVDGIVVATPPETAAQLLDGLTDTALLRGFTHEPITSCYLQYPSGTRLDRPFYALLADDKMQAWGQFVFDRGHIIKEDNTEDNKEAQAHTAQDGLFAVVISTSAQAIAQGHDALGTAVAQQLATSFGRAELATPAWIKVISEKRATFAATPGLVRPDNTTGHAQIVIAGDYTASDYPATLESAVRSGMSAANILLDTP